MSFDAGGEDGINDINITPFVDVVLVLLVIFMVTAPMMMKDVLDLQLPNAVTSDQTDVGTLGVTVLKSGQILINGELSTLDTLETTGRAQAEKDPLTQVIIAADLDARHGAVVQVIDTVRKVGLTNFAIQVEKQVEAGNE